MADLKICLGCGENFPLTEFWNSKSTKDGKRNKCKKCTAAQNDKWRFAHLDLLAEKHKDYMKTKYPYISSPIKDCFYFLNNSFVSKFNPTRKIIKEKNHALGKKIFLHECTTCHESYRSFSGVAGTCPVCSKRIYERQLAGERLQNSQLAEASASKFDSLLSTCSKSGTCDVLAAHHELLGNDPERLSTEFLVKIICQKTYVSGSMTMKKDKNKGRPRT